MIKMRKVVSKLLPEIYLIGVPTGVCRFTNEEKSLVCQKCVLKRKASKKVDCMMELHELYK